MTLKETIQAALWAEISLSIDGSVEKIEQFGDTVITTLVVPHDHQVCEIERASDDIRAEIPMSDQKKQADGTRDKNSGLVEESTGDVGEKEMVVAEDSHSFLVEESCVDSCILAVEPLPHTPGANDRHRYFYTLIPSFNLLYSNLLMGLGGGVDYHDCTMPMRSYVVCVGIHWSIDAGFMYWRSVLLVGGAIVVQEMAYEWGVRRLLPGVDDSGIAMKSESYCDYVMDVTYFHGVHWNYVEGWMFCAPYDNPYVKYLYMGLSKVCIWDPGWISKPWDWNMFIHHLGGGYVLVYEYFRRLFIPQDSLRCQTVRCWFCLCYSFDFLHWVGVNLGDRGKGYVKKDTYVKHECERYTRVLKGYKHTCEGNYCLFCISNLILQVFIHLKMPKLLLDADHSLQVLYPLDSRTNLLEERGNVMEETPIQVQEQLQQEDHEDSSPISLPQGPITRSRAKKLQQALNSHLQSLVSTSSEELQGDKNYWTRERPMELNLMKILWSEFTPAQGGSTLPAYTSSVGATEAFS